VIPVPFNCGTFRCVIARNRDYPGAPSCGVKPLLGLEESITRERLVRFVQESGHAIEDVLEWLEGHAGEVAALGASTKGNIILELIGADPNLIPVIGEVNPDKFGRVTPGTMIPIVPEASLDQPHLLVLPWAFRDFFVQNIDRFVPPGGSLAFPLPSLEIVYR
jgi:NDP-4-keto-2,6-dideoxyhexose 3-C-methyltransferase